MNKGLAITLFHPAKKHLENLISISNVFDRIFIFDNSENEATYYSFFPEELKKKIAYFRFGKNFGISIAMNVCCKKALDEKIDFLLLLDQDSEFEAATITYFFNRAREIVERDPKVAIIGPTIDYHHTISKRKCRTEKHENAKDWIITSGTMINMPLYKQYGYFDPAYFIAYLEPDFCLRARKRGYQIIVISDVILYQTLGSPIKIWGRDYFLEPPIREYYIHRNRLYYSKKNVAFFKRFKYQLKSINDYFRVFFIEPNKKERLQFLIKGRKDYLHKKMGKIAQ